MDIFNQINGTDDNGDIFDNYPDQLNDSQNLSNTAPFKFGKSLIRGVGKAASNVLERSANIQEDASLPALLGIKPDVSTERNISKYIQENVPEETGEFLPDVLGAGIEVAADPASLLGGIGTSFIMGATGKALEKAGAPKWLQIAGEIGSTLFKKNPKKNFSEKSPEIKEAQELMRKSGLLEEEITLATNALKEKKTLESAAKMYKSTEKQIESTKQNLEKGVNEIIAESFPGFEKGIQEVEKRADALFNPVNKIGKNLVISKTEKFNKKVEEIIEDVRDNLANTPDEEAFISMLQRAKASAIEGKTASPYIKFYRTLNRIGKWVDPSKKEHYMTEAKDAIKSTFRDNGPVGNKLASEFETANKGWVKFKDAEDLSEIIKKSHVDEKLDFSRLSKSLSNDKNYSTVKNALGEKAAANLKIMSKIGQQIERSEKGIRGGSVKQGMSFGKAFTGVSALLSMSPYTIATSIAGSASIEIGQYLATQLLTNPKYQNLWIRMANKIKSGNVAQAEVISNQIYKMAEKDFSSTQSK